MENTQKGVSMKVFLTLPDGLAGRLEKARIVYNRANPSRPASTQDLVRFALELWLDNLKQENTKQKRQKGKRT